MHQDAKPLYDWATYNEIVVQASLIVPESIVAFFTTITTGADHYEVGLRVAQDMKEQTGLDIPLLHYDASSGWSMATKPSEDAKPSGGGVSSSCAECDCGWTANGANCGGDDGSHCYSCCCK